MSDSTCRRHRCPSSTELSDWFQRACRQEKGALPQLLMLYQPLLLQLAHRRVRGALRVKVSPSDVVQASVWKATQAFPEQTFSDRRGFFAWLVTILDNEAADVRRKFRQAHKRDVSRERPLEAPEVQDWLSRLSISLYASDQESTGPLDNLERLCAAITRLPPHYQLMVRLRYYEQLGFHAIGKRLNRSYDASRMLHDRALKRLRTELGLRISRDSTNTSGS